MTSAFSPPATWVSVAACDLWNDNRDATYNATIAASGLGSLDPQAVNPNANTNSSYQNFLDTWEVEEKTRAAYVQGSFKFDELAVPISGTLGRALCRHRNPVGRIQPGCSYRVRPVTFPRASRDGGYTKWLPSLNLRFDLTDELVGRMTAGKVLARPESEPAGVPPHARRRRLYRFARQPGSAAVSRPRNTTSGLECYFSQDGFVSATAFRKEISSFIINTSTREELDGSPGDGSADEYTVTRPINGDDKVTINGIEGGAQYAFDFLPAPFNGFGALANVTYQKDEGYKGVNIITSETLPFPGLSHLSYNASLYFENERFSARASYNWREEWLVNPSGRGALPEFTEDFGSLDASVSVTIVPEVTVFLEAINLLDEDAHREQHSGTAHRQRDLRLALLPGSPRKVLDNEPGGFGRT